MLIFIKFSEDKWRDAVVERLQSDNGIIWKQYGVKIKGYSLDAEVKFFRLLGVSPETTEEEIKRTFVQLGIGEVVDIKKGFIDEKRLPGVTNGTWSLRVKILDQEKIIPSYVHRRDEGELWSLNFEGRVFCCWKCGSGNHIGDKCRDQTRTFDEVFNGSASDEGFVKPTWAAVVRTGQAEDINEMESRVKAANKLKEQAKREAEEAKLRQDYLEKQRRWAKERMELDKREAKTISDEISYQAMDNVSDSQILSVVGTEIHQANNANRKNVDTSKDVIEEVSVSDSALVTAEVVEKLVVDASKGNDILPVSAQKESCSMGVQQTGLGDGDYSDNPKVDQEIDDSDKRDLSIVFGPGATKLEKIIQTRGVDGIPRVLLSESSSDKSSASTSTPVRQRSRGRTRNRNSGRSSISSPSPIRPPDKNGNKKLKFDDGIGETKDNQDGAMSCDAGPQLDASQKNATNVLSDSGDWGSSFEGALPVDGKELLEGGDKGSCDEMQTSPSLKAEGGEGGVDSQTGASSVE